jgi:hypothetical protein
MAREVRTLAASSVLLFLVQETLERSVPAGRVVPAAFVPSQWLTLLAATAVASLVLVVALRLAAGAVRAVLGRSRPRAAGVAYAPSWSVVAARPVRLRPLAQRFGLRAPPVVPA